MSRSEMLIEDGNEIKNYSLSARSFGCPFELVASQIERKCDKFLPRLFRFMLDK